MFAVKQVIKNAYQKDFWGSTGWTFFFVFLVISIIFYKECVIYQDNASEMCFVISGRINPVPFRWGVIPFRIFAVVGPYIDLSLKMIFLMTSIWFILFKMIVWYICHYQLKNTLAGILVIFSILLSFQEGFFAQALQMYEASLYFCILFAFLMHLEKNQNKIAWWNYIFLVAMLILIKGTHITIFLICPILLLYYNQNKINLLKVVGFISWLVISILYMTVLQHPYEGQHVTMIFDTINNFKISDYNGIYLYILKEIFDLNFFFPFIAFLLLSYLLIKEKKYLLTIISYIFFAVIFCMIFFKLGAKAIGYPLSDDYVFYMQAAFYSLIFIVVSLLFYEMNLKSEYRETIQHPIIKTAVPLIILFYTSSIILSGIEKKEYNYYLKTLLSQLDEDYEEKIIIIDAKLLPFRFSKVNINGEYETLIKSNLMFGKSMSLFITPYPTPIRDGENYPVYLNGVYQVDKTDVSKFEYNHYRKLYPSTYFNELSDRYFHFDNLNTAVLDEEYMKNFNKQYGFTINEY